MRILLSVLVLAALISPSHAQECVPADFDVSQLIGRWDEVYCHDPLEDRDCRSNAVMYFRADGSFVQTNGTRIVWRGTWCVTTQPRDPWAPSPPFEPLIEIESGGSFSSMHFTLCNAPEACPYGGMVLERGLGTMGASTIADFIWSHVWQYAGEPVSSDATSWGAVKGLFR
jgi:hypothetical protein